MTRKKFILFFLLAVSVSLFGIGAVFTLAGGKPLRWSFFYQFIVNLPLCLLLGVVDIYMARLIRRLPCGLAVRILADLCLTSIVAFLLPVCINFLLLDTDVGTAAKMSLSILPWNWIVVLQIEIFFNRRTQADMEKEKARYQYEALKNQINPHFLFNSLNVLSNLAYQDADKANMFAKKLSGVYRYVLDTRARDTVPISEEVSFVRSYLYLESIRFDGVLQVHIDDSLCEDNRKIIPTGIQVLVENALKHNINTPYSPLRIRIGAEDRGVCVSNNIQLRAHVPGHGIGLDNLRQQYLLHGKDITLVRSGGTFTVILPYLK